MKLKKILCLLTAFSLLVGSTGAYAESTTTTDVSSSQALEDYLKEFIKNNFKDEVTDQQLDEAQIKGMFESLDPHSVYFTEEEYTKFRQSLSGTFVGIGAYLEAYNGYVKITKPIPGSPAEKAGLLPGDVILKVDNVNIENMPIDNVTARIKGKEGTKVTLTIYKASTKKEVKVTITRAVISFEIVSSKMLNKEQGYVSLEAFDAGASSKVIKAVEDLKKKGAKQLVIDLRNNPGGYLDEAIALSDYFLSNGDEIVSIDYRSEPDQMIMDDTTGSSMPLVVLVNGSSASASEIFASAMQKNNRAKIVGTNSYGKGTVQTFRDLPSGGGFKLTIAEYKGPNNTKIDGIGVKPDYVVKLPDASEKLKFDNLAPFAEAKVYSAGETGLNVYAAQQRLNLFGNKLSLTGKMDTATVNALKVYQKDNKLSITSKIDASTKKSLEEKTKQLYNQITFDSQLGKALEVLKNL